MWIHCLAGRAGRATGGCFGIGIFLSFKICGKLGGAGYLQSVLTLACVEWCDVSLCFFGQCWLAELQWKDGDTTRGLCTKTSAPLDGRPLRLKPQIDCGLCPASLTLKVLHRGIFHVQSEQETLLQQRLWTYPVQLVTIKESETLLFSLVARAACQRQLSVSKLDALSHVIIKAGKVGWF